MAKAEVRVTVSPDGTLRFVYADELRELLDVGAARITRASHVEPDGTSWRADMSPVGGPVLGPFETRAAALSAEVAYLAEHMHTLTI